MRYVRNDRQFVTIVFQYNNEVAILWKRQASTTSQYVDFDIIGQRLIRCSVSVRY
jgi:hypothetical protein